MRKFLSQKLQEVYVLLVFYYKIASLYFGAADYDTAIDVIKTSLNNTNIKDWICKGCSETNAASFDLCWNCQHESVA